MRTDIFPPPIPKEVIKDTIPILEKSTIVLIQEKDKKTFITGIVLINAPIEKVWSVVMDFEKYHEFVPNVSKVKVLEKYPESNTLLTEYNISFNIALGLKFTITYTLLQTEDKENWVKYGIPSPTGKQAFRDVSYRENYYDFDGKTVMIYTASADLSSFGLLSKLIYKYFPELEIPSLVAVSTLFPEAVKERIEGIKIIEEKENKGKINFPERIELKSIKEIVKRYGIVILSWYPKDGVRFFSTFFKTKKDISYAKSVVLGFENYKKFFKLVDNVKVVKSGESPIVDWELKYKVVFPIEIKYRVKYFWSEDKKRLFSVLDENGENDIEYYYGVWDFYEDKDINIVGFTGYADIGENNRFVKILMDKVRGFKVGLRVASTSTIGQSFSDAMK